MIVTITVNRIINYGVAAMLCSCLFLWVIKSDILGFSQSTHMQIIAENTRSKASVSVKKNTIQTVAMNELKPGMPALGATTNAVITQKNNKAKNDRPKSWYEDPSMYDKPDFQKLNMYQTKELLDRYYKDLYKLLDLDFTTRETLRGLLAEKSMAMDKALSKLPDEYSPAVYDRGANGISVYDSVTGGVNSEYDEKLSALLGPDKFSQMCEYEMILPERNQITKIRSELEFTSEPLTIDQETALLSVLENNLANDPRRSAKNMAQARTNSIAKAMSMNVSNVNINIFNGTLTTGQIEMLIDFQNRDKNWDLVNYAWGGMGDQMRKQGKKR